MHESCARIARCSEMQIAANASPVSSNPQCTIASAYGAVGSLFSLPFSCLTPKLLPSTQTLTQSLLTFYVHLLGLPNLKPGQRASKAINPHLQTALFINFSHPSLSPFATRSAQGALPLVWLSSCLRHEGGRSCFSDIRFRTEGARIAEI